MKKQTKNYKTDFFLISDRGMKALIKYRKKWAYFDLAKAKEDNFNFHYADSLKLEIAKSAKYKKPAFFQVAAIGTELLMPMTLINPETGLEITLLGVPDSGASISVLSYEVAEYLGIDLKRCLRIESYLSEVHKKVISYQVDLGMRIGKDEAFITPVHFLKQEETAFLIGRAGFFEHYEVVFSPECILKYRFVG